MWQLSGPLQEQILNYFGWFWAFFSWFGSLLWSGSHFVTWKLPLEDWKPYLGSFDENRRVGYHDCCSGLAVHMLSIVTGRMPGKDLDFPYISAFTLVLCHKKASSSCNLSMLHIRSTQSVHKLSMNVTDTSIGVSSYKWHLGRIFW